MLKQVSRTAVVLAGAASMFMGAACASADTQQGSMGGTASRQVAARQIEAGQSRYLIPGEALAPAPDRAPYALTGRDRADADRGMRAFTGPTGRWVQTGQTRTWLPPTP